MVNDIKTVEQELQYMDKVWTKLDTLEKVVILTVTFLYLYFVIVVLASYESLTKNSADPDSGKAIFALIVITTIITIAPVVLHYLGISTFGVIHIIGLAGVVTFVAALWLLFESFDKRELNTEAYKDPYSMAIYFLLVSFSVIYVTSSVSRKF
tara:strand:+ start:437 stop:895 length:459 start_codon:yes stop_codon:yes gene_type:complete